MRNDPPGSFKFDPFIEVATEVDKRHAPRCSFHGDIIPKMEDAFVIRTNTTPASVMTICRGCATLISSKIARE